MRVVVISLRCAQTRREHVRREMAAAGVRFTFFDAIEGEAGRPLFSAISMRQYRINSRRAPLPGEIGCYASHRAIWQHCASGTNPILVLEDDFQLLSGFNAALGRLDALTREYGFIRLDSIHRGRSGAAAARRSLHSVHDDGQQSLYYVSDVPLCMLAYTISPAAAAALVEASKCVTAPVDKFMQRTWEHGVPVFGIMPTLVTTAAISATSTIGCRPRKSWNLVLLGMRAADKIRGRILRWRFDHRELRRLVSGGNGGCQDRPGQTAGSGRASVRARYSAPRRLWAD